MAAVFSATVESRLTAESLSPPARAFLAQAVDRPLDTSVPDRMGGEARPVQAILGDASVRALRVSLWATAALLVLGGLISAAGIRKPRR